MLLDAGDLSQFVVDQLVGVRRSVQAAKPLPVENRCLDLPSQSGLPMVASFGTVFVDICGSTGRSTRNHIIFLHQFGTIGESDRQFVIL
jgi:hypothetical protein